MTPLQRACIVLAYQLEMLRQWQRAAEEHAAANPPRVVRVVGNRIDMEIPWLPPPEFD